MVTRAEQGGDPARGFAVADDAAYPALDGGNVWQAAALGLIARTRRSLGLLLFAAVLGAIIGIAVKSVLPPTYKATAEVLIDPRGLKIFADDLSASQMDANAQINFIESQMAVLHSDRVLLRVIREEHLSDSVPSAPAGSNETAETRVLAQLQKAITVTRAERTFVVDVTASAPTPDGAARLANAVIEAYLAEDARDRSTVAKRLTAELSGRLETLRDNLRASETKAETYRVENGLVGVQNRLVVEQRLIEATTALSAAQNREAQARSRLKQLMSEPLDATSIGLPGNDPESRRLAGLMERLTAAKGDLAQLQATLGARHPVIESAANRVKEIEAAIRDSLNFIRKAAKAEAERAQAESAALSRNLAALSADVAAVRRAEVELRSLERDVESNRKILDSFETRSREANEFGQIDHTYTRVVSPARAPTPSGGLVGRIVWGIAGAIMAVLSMLAVFAVSLIRGEGRAVAEVRQGRAPQAPRHPLVVRRRARAKSDGAAPPAGEAPPKNAGMATAAAAVPKAPTSTPAEAGRASREPRVVLVRPPTPKTAPPVFKGRTLKAQVRPTAVARSPEAPAPAAAADPPPVRQNGRAASGQWRFLS